MTDNNTVSSLKRAIRSKDPKLIGQAVEALGAQGLKYRDIYRIFKKKTSAFRPRLVRHES